MSKSDNTQPKWKYYNVFRRFCAFVIGVVLFLSGILKLMDPVGAGLVVDEYYKFLHLGFLSATAKCFGTALAFTETVLGVALMTGLWRKVVAIITFSLLGAFTVVTIILLAANPEMDCGCFGEAVHLTHLQSLLKNIALLVLAFAAFFPGRLGKPRRRKYVAFGIVSAFVLVFGIYSLLYIPLVDFTDFRPGARLEASMDSSTGTYSATFVYEKDGEERNFTLEDLPDSTWTYVRTETVRTAQSDEVVAVLPFTDRYGEESDNLAAWGDVMVFSLYNVEGMSAGKWERLAGAVLAAQQAGFTPLILAAADYQAVSMALSSKFADGGFPYGVYDPDVERNEYRTGYDGLAEGREVKDVILQNLYSADYKTILTMNRSNGGATYFRDGSLVTKWAFRVLPDEQKLSQILSADMADTLVETSIKRHLVYESLLVIAFGVLFFV